VTYLQTENLVTVLQEVKKPYCLRRAIVPAIFSDCSSYDIYPGVSDAMREE
jgi:hypothetical protein